ncbi:ATP-binding protein [Myxococcota bacterium]|nr:ATP-binding protein [Myxococcota bacterium]
MMSLEGPQRADGLFAGPGELRALCRSVDWSATALGPVERWPSPLRTLVRTILDSRSTMAIWASSAHVLIYNDGYVPVLGKRHPAAMGQTAREVWPEVWPDFGPELERVLATGAATHHSGASFRLWRRGREELAFFSYSFTPVRDDDGRILAVLNVLEETTDTVGALRASEALNSFFLRLSDVLLPLSDAAEIQAAATRMLRAELGVARAVYSERSPDGRRAFVRAESLADGARSVLGEYDSAYFGAKLAETLRIGRTYVCPDVAQLPELTDVMRQAHASLDVGAYIAAPLVRDGGVRATLSVHEPTPREWTPDEIRLVEGTAARTWDAAERARAEAAVRASEEKYRTLFDSIDEGFCEIEVIFEGETPVDYRFLEVNPAFEKLTGLCNVVGVRVRDLVPTHESHWFEIYGRVASTGESVRFQNVAAGLGRVYDVYAFRAGRPGSRRVAVLFDDITEQRRAEDALRDADRRKDHFLAVLSHELRNPLAPIRNSLYILDRAEPGGPQAKRAQAVISRQVDQLSRLVDDLLDVTRISRGKIHLQRERVELGALVRRTIDDHRAQIERGGLEIVLEAPDRPAFVDADPSRIAQVLGNLLQNAAKFTAPGGTIVVALSTDEAERRARVSVRDTGAGMSAELLERLFEPFIQADATLARSQGGLGLGLALVKGLVELHGGSVAAASAGLGHGSELRFELPLASAPSDVRPPREATTAQVHRRVLVIEDNIDAAETLRQVLELEGHEVAVAHDGRDGLRLARSFRPDLVLCDIGLPGLDGYAVAQAFRADEGLRRTELVALSGYAQPEDLQRAEQAGFTRHLAKPPSIEKLQRILSGVPAG